MISPCASPFPRKTYAIGFSVNSSAISRAFGTHTNGRRAQIRRLLEESLDNPRYAGAIEVLIKSVLLEPSALYRIPAWAEQFEIGDIGAGRLKDDVLGRALDRLFQAQRATLQTKITIAAIEAYNIDVNELHCDSTSIKIYGAYRGQSKKAVQLKLGHSKDHRPDLKQLLYNLTVARDGAIPMRVIRFGGRVITQQLAPHTPLAKYCQDICDGDSCCRNTGCTR